MGYSVSHTLRVRTGAQDSGSPAIGLNSPVSSTAAIQAGAQGWSGVLTDLEPETFSEMIKTACDSCGSGVWGPGQGMAAAKMQKITETRTY